MVVPSEGLRVAVSTTTFLCLCSKIFLCIMALESQASLPGQPKLLHTTGPVLQYPIPSMHIASTYID